jgi:hypothetical protein
MRVKVSVVEAAVILALLIRAWLKAVIEIDSKRPASGNPDRRRDEVARLRATA